MIKKGLSGTDFLDQTCSKSLDLKNADPRTKMDEPKKKNNKLHGSHNTTPRYGQYLTHAHSHITRAAIDSCFGLVGPHQHGTFRLVPCAYTILCCLVFV